MENNNGIKTVFTAIAVIIVFETAVEYVVKKTLDTYSRSKQIEAR